MLLRERKYRTCKSCKSRHFVRGEVYGCDGCRTEIDMGKPERQYLSATVFSQSNGNRDIHACSWKCMVKTLRATKCDYFVSMPFLHYEADHAKGRRASDFFALLKG